MRNSFEPKLCRFEVKRWLVVMGLVAATHLVCQSLMLPYGNALRSLLNVNREILDGKANDFQLRDSSKTVVDDKHAVEGSYSSGSSTSAEQDKDGIKFGTGRNIRDAVIVTQSQQNVTDVEDEGVKEVAEFAGEEEVDDDSKLGESAHTDKNSLENTKQPENETGLEVNGKEARQGLFIEQIIEPYTSADTSLVEQKTVSLSEVRGENAMIPLISTVGTSYAENLALSANTSPGPVSLSNDLMISASNTTSILTPIKKKMKCDTPPKSVTPIDKMNRILIRNRRSSRSMKQRWSSACDQEILAAKEQIQKAPTAWEDHELYAPLFRNISTFKSFPAGYDLKQYDTEGKHVAFCRRKAFA